MKKFMRGVLVLCTAPEMQNYDLYKTTMGGLFRGGLQAGFSKAKSARAWLVQKKKCGT